MKAVLDWLRGWAATLRIMLFERETYRFLRENREFNPDEFVEVSEPGETREG